MHLLRMPVYCELMILHGQSRPFEAESSFGNSPCPENHFDRPAGHLVGPARSLLSAGSFATQWIRSPEMQPLCQFKVRSCTVQERLTSKADSLLRTFPGTLSLLS